MYRRGLLSTLVFAAFVAGCSDVEPGNGPPSEDESDPDDRAEIVDHELVRHDHGTDEATVAIEGRVRINEADLQHVELRGQFFDADDEPLDTTFERLQDLEIGTQSFEVQYPEVGPVTEAVDEYAIEITTIV